MIFTTSAAETFTVSGVDADDSDLDGWYLTATATYKLQGDGDLVRGSVTSRLSTPVPL
ncbi:MAG: hypothetical protein K2Y37_24415 [Pirellulales bacterium]|nr:hypothetical protein [Pirellulales bacterium]